MPPRELLGERVWPNKFGQLRLPEGGYGTDLAGRWWCRPPGGNMRAVEVEEHPDGTATVLHELSINGTGKRCQLTAGIWFVD